MLSVIIYIYIYNIKPKGTGSGYDINVLVFSNFVLCIIILEKTFYC